MSGLVDYGIIDPNQTNALARGYDAAVDRRNALAQQERANKLADLQYNQAMDIENQRRALQSFMANKDPNAPDFERGLGMIIGPQGMVKYQKERAEADKNKLETETKQFDLQHKKLDFTLQAVSASPTPEKAIYHITQGIKNGVFSMQEASQELAQLQNISPEDYAQYRMTALQRTLQAKDQLDTIAPKIDRLDTGAGFVAMQGNRFQPRYGQAMQGVASIPKTPTFGEKTAQGNLSLAQQKFQFEQANPGITVQQTEDGTLVGVNNRTGQAMPITMGNAAPVVPAADPASNAFSPRLPPTAAPAVTQAVPGMPSVLDQRAPVTPATAALAAPMTGTPLRGKGTALTESQSNAVAFGMRMKEANAILQDLANKGTFRGANIEATPFVGESLGKVLPSFLGGTSEQQQQVNQAKNNFITAVLRKESGAAIGKNEFDTEDKKYFPQFGDSAAVIKQKENARNLAIQSMGIQAGPGVKNIDEYQPSVNSKTVTDPTGMVHTFPTPEAAAAYKKAAGIK